VGIINLALKLYSLAAIGCRKVSKVLQVILPQLNQKAPHHTTVRQWVHRLGCHALKKPLEKSDDWVAIGDATVGIGQMKCLAILGVKMGKLEERGNLTLTHEDVEVLELAPTKSATGEHAFKALKKAGERVGGFAGIVIDQGSDVTKGGKRYTAENPDVTVVCDIKHKMALCLKHALEDDSEWEKYLKCMSETRSRVQQTELKVLAPPKKRAKGRYMDIYPQVAEWPDLLTKFRLEGNREIITEERYQQYFDWVEEYASHLEKWRFMVETAKMITSVTREHGISVEVQKYLLDFFIQVPIEEKELQTFIENVFTSLNEEVEKLNPGQTMLCSSEVLESIFGKYKEINEVTQGITGNVLGINAFVGKATSMDEIKEALEGCPVKEACKWVRDKVGDTVASMRKRLFSKKKSSKQIAVYSEPKIPTGAFPQEENSNRLVSLDESIDLDASKGVTSSEPEITRAIA